jgi:ADP-heptose:LPS heptosyltransferase
MNGPIDPAPLRRIVALRLDNVGDVVLVGPALRAIKARAPHAGLTLLASPAGAAVALLLPAVDQTWMCSFPHATDPERWP